MTSCLIIGAGIAGLLAGKTLQEAGWSVTVLDKGRGVGGRMANRRLNDDGSARADHGAQFFTARSPRFQRLVDDWLAADVAREWTRGFGNRDGHPRYRGRPGMTAIPKHLAAELNVLTGMLVTSVTAGNGLWRAETADGDQFEADTLLMTPPVPQTLALLDAGDVTIPVEYRQPLSLISYDPCFAVLVTLEGPSRIPAPGAVQVRGEPIGWIADNAQKGVSAASTVTIHAGPQFTTTYFDADRTEVAQRLLDAAAAAGWLELEQVRSFQVQRWRYAQPTVFYPERQLLIPAAGDRPVLAFAGDAFAEAKVEGAALSGLAAAEALLGIAAR